MHVIRRRWQAGVLALSLALAWADYAVGPFVLVPITYAVPVGLAAWHLGRGWGVSLAVALTAARFLSVLAWGDAGFSLPVGLANAGLRLGVLTGLAVLLARVEGLQRRLRGRVGDAGGAAARVHVLQEHPQVGRRVGAVRGVRGRAVGGPVQPRLLRPVRAAAVPGDVRRVSRRAATCRLPGRSRRAWLVVPRPSSDPAFALGPATSLGLPARVLGVGGPRDDRTEVNCRGRFRA